MASRHAAHEWIDLNQKLKALSDYELLFDVDGDTDDGVESIVELIVGKQISQYLITKYLPFSDESSLTLPKHGIAWFAGSILAFRSSHDQLITRIDRVRVFMQYSSQASCLYEIMHFNFLLGKVDKKAFCYFFFKYLT